MHWQTVSLFIHSLHSDFFPHALFGGEFIDGFAVVNIDECADANFLIIIAITLISHEMCSLRSGSCLSELSWWFVAWNILIYAL
jgi:hypothetical protein